METIRIRGNLHTVGELPQPMQNLIALYEHVTEQELRVRRELGTLEHAKQNLSRELDAFYGSWIAEQQTVSEPTPE